MSKEIDSITGIHQIPESGTFWVKVEGSEAEVENVRDRLGEMKRDPNEPFNEDASFLVASHGIELSLL